MIGLVKPQWVRGIEGRDRTVVIDVPFSAVLPRHAWLKQTFDVSPEEFDRAAEILD
jgi:hypothetical protein